ncbi:FecR domain-containing protein [Pseudoxanthomonas sp. UTMC 1351]|uniref:FecR domain-containing protein n=1 Tax=Pseudoxanthomonas sp. UTMC 1351 TaxID=2695853 RepID=UPI0034CE6E71
MWIALLVLCAPASAQEWTYRIRPGDTLWNLAGEHLKPGIRWQQLQQHNRIGNPYRLPPGTVVRIPLTWLARQPVKAKVMLVRGDATVALGKTSRKITQGMQLGAGALLKTAADASLCLQFADGSRLVLQGDSELRLDRLSRFGRSGMVDTRLRLQRGRITNDVEPIVGPGAGFIVETPSASSAVRGTQFRVEAASARTLTEVLEGGVAVSAKQKPTLIPSGFGSVVEAGQAGAVKAVRLLPAPDLSALSAAGRQLGRDVSWPPVDGAVRYRMQASDQSDFGTLVADQQVDTPQTRMPALPAGDYFLRVRAIDAQGLEGQDAVVPFSIENPLPPYAIAPAADAVVRDSPVALSWTQAPGASTYRYQVASDRQFDQPLVDISGIGDTQVKLPKSLPPGTYFWRVASIDAAGKQGSFGDVMTFELRLLAEAGQIDSEAAENQSDAVTFRWQAGPPDQRYRFQMSRTPDFSTLKIDEMVSKAEITVPKPGSGTWYLRAQAIGSDGFEGPFPEPQVVKIPCRFCRIGAGAGALIILLTL